MNNKAIIIQTHNENIVFLLALSLTAARCSMKHTAPFEDDHPYIHPADPAVSEKLAEWHDWKFGVLIHWGPYSQWGVVESWSLCPLQPLSLLLTL